MRSSREVTLTFKVKIKVPTGMTTNEMQQYLRAAIVNYSGALPPDEPIFNLQEQDFTVALLKKEVIYA